MGPFQRAYRCLKLVYRDYIQSCKWTVHHKTLDRLTKKWRKLTKEKISEIHDDSDFQKTQFFGV